MSDPAAKLNAPSKHHFDHMQTHGQSSLKHIYHMMDGKSMNEAGPLPKTGLDYPFMIPAGATLGDNSGDRLPLGIDPGTQHAQDILAFFDALEKGDLFKVEHYVLKRNVDVHTRDAKDGATALHIAAHVGPVEVMEFLLKQGADIDARDNQKFTPLHTAAACEHTRHDAMKFLLEHNADVNARNSFGGTPLHLAAISGHLDGVVYLVRHKADINLTRRDGSTALHLAVYHRNSEVASYLAEVGAEINRKNNLGETPLHYAATRHGLGALVQLFVRKGAVVNAKDDNGATPLHHAAAEGNLEVVRFLCEHGAVLSYNHRRQSQYDLAKLYDHKSCVEFLKEFAREQQKRLLAQQQGTSSSSSGAAAASSSSSASGSEANQQQQQQQQQLLHPTSVNNHQLQRRGSMTPIPRTPEEAGLQPMSGERAAAVAMSTTGAAGVGGKCKGCEALTHERDDLLNQFRKERAEWKAKVDHLKRQLEKTEHAKDKEVERLTELLHGAEAARRYDMNLLQAQIDELRGGGGVKYGTR